MTCELWSHIYEESIRKITAILDDVLEMLNKMIFINRQSTKRKLTPSSQLLAPLQLPTLVFRATFS